MMKMYFTKLFAVLFLAASVSVAQSSSANDSPKKATKSKGEIVSFKSDVFPLIKKYCLPCHSEENTNPSELHLDSYDVLMRGGKHGPAILPGKPEESILIQKLSDNPPFGEPMPLKSKTGLSEEEIRILSDWIQKGAKKN
jgi:uncharacterized membrane protein